MVIDDGFTRINKLINNDEDKVVIDMLINKLFFYNQLEVLSM